MDFDFDVSTKIKHHTSDAGVLSLCTNTVVSSLLLSPSPVGGFSVMRAPLAFLLEIGLPGPQQFLRIPPCS